MKINKEIALRNCKALSDTLKHTIDAMLKNNSYTDDEKRLLQILRATISVTFQNIIWLIKNFNNEQTPYNIIKSTGRYILECEADLDYILSNEDWHAALHNFSSIMDECGDNTFAIEDMKGKNIGENTAARVEKFFKKYNFKRTDYYISYCCFTHCNLLGLILTENDGFLKEKKLKDSYADVENYGVCLMKILERQKLFPELSQVAERFFILAERDKNEQ